MEELLNYLALAEGKEVHRNEGEDDITSPYGIYKKVYPNEEIFKYLDNVAEEIGIYKDSSEWTQEDIDKINASMNIEIVKLYVKSFYVKYLKNTPYNILPNECKLAFFSMYTNSKTKAIKALQQSIIDMYKTLNLSTSKLSIVDGSYGAKTEMSIRMLVNKKDKYLYYWLETLMISNMKTQYIRLVISH